MGYKLHQRVMIVQSAQIDLNAAVLDVVKKYDLTFTELFGILNQAEAHWLKYALRDERHPDDPDVPAGIE